MKFQLNVYAAPWSGNTAEQAQGFAQRLLAEQHQLCRIFFFFDGVYHGLGSQAPSSDDYPLLAGWQQLAAQNVELLLCIAASANRGILDTTEAKRHQKPAATLADGFQLAGLGQWAAGFREADRIVSFR